MFDCLINSTIPETDSFASSDLKVTIHQKRRGQGKKISQIHEGECIRVDKQKGKALHLEVTGKMAASYGPEDRVEVTAVDLNKEPATFTNDGIKLVAAKKVNDVVTLILKVHRNARALVFGVTIVNTKQVSFGHSVSINAHNNGKQNSTRDTKAKKRGATKRKRSTITASIDISGETPEERSAVKQKTSSLTAPLILISSTNGTPHSPWSEELSDFSFLSADACLSSPYSSDVSTPSYSSASGMSSPYSSDATYGVSPSSSPSGNASTYGSSTEEEFGVSFDFLSSFETNNSFFDMNTCNDSFSAFEQPGAILPVW